MLKRKVCFFTFTERAPVSVMTGKRGSEWMADSREDDDDVPHGKEVDSKMIHTGSTRKIMESDTSSSRQKEVVCPV